MFHNLWPYVLKELGNTIYNAGIEATRNYPPQGRDGQNSGGEEMGYDVSIPPRYDLVTTICFPILILLPYRHVALISTHPPPLHQRISRQAPRGHPLQQNKPSLSSKSSEIAPRSPLSTAKQTPPKKHARLQSTPATPSLSSHAETARSHPNDARPVGSSKQALRSCCSAMVQRRRGAPGDPIRRRWLRGVGGRLRSRRIC